MEKLMQVLSAIFAVKITADQRKQIEEVVGKEFVAADDASKSAARLDELTKQLAERDKDLEKLKANANRTFAQLPQNGGTDAAEQRATGNKSEELEKQFDNLNKKYAEATEKLAAQETDYAAEKLKKNDPDVFVKDTPRAVYGQHTGECSRGRE